MTDRYTIYLVNRSARPQQFWCFLSPPRELAGDPGVFPNSSVSLVVGPHDRAPNRFVIPVRYVVGAGAGNNAVGPQVEIVSDVTREASPGDSWEAIYADAPPNRKPRMLPDGRNAPDNTIQLASNAFPKHSNDRARWYSNQSFGVVTDQGFAGMTWSPKPAETRTLTPKLAFYVSVGSYHGNALASWEDVANDAAVITAPDSFSAMNCTVTYDERGKWSVTPGPPPA